MASSTNRNSTMTRLAARAVLRYMRFVRRTADIVVEPADARQRLIVGNHPFILAMWHGQFLMLPFLHTDGIRVSAMVARHGDAEAVTDLLRHFDIELVRGAGAGGRKRDRGGAAALRAAVRLLESGSTLAMTADVPGDRPRRAGDGIVTLARLSGRPVLPIAAATSRFVALPTWSRLTVNMPYSKLAFVVGEPIFVPPDAEGEGLEKGRRAIEAGLDAATARAYAIVGADATRATPPTAPSAVAAPSEVSRGVRAYRRLTAALKPAAPLLLKLRARQGKEIEARRGERFGVASLPRPEGRLVWVHAASVGEANAVIPLIEELGKRRADLRFLLTTGTVTSAALARQRLGARAVHQFVPLDIADYARAFLAHWRPDLAVFTESEVWPNLIVEASAAGVPLALVNGRMSGRSARRWRRMAAAARTLFSRFDLILAQNEKLARNFAALGARDVRSVGNLKVDAPPPPVDPTALATLRAALDGRPVVVAASTHEGEEEVVADAHRILARDIPGLLTIIAPRHPSRGPALAQRLSARGLRVARRAAGEMPGAAIDIYLADTIGELGTLYALAPVAFVGGSLIDRGGQNPIEPIRHGAAVLTGPSWRNFQDFYRALLRHKGVREVRNADELAAAAGAILAGASERDAMRAGAAAALLSLGGALARTTDALLEHLPAAGEVGCVS